MANKNTEQQNLYEVTHSSPEIKTVQDYLDQSDSPAFMMRENPDEFLNIKGPDGLTNLERIQSKYLTPSDKQLITTPPVAATPANKLLLKVGTKLYVPIDKVNRIGLLTQGIEVASTNTEAFMANALASLQANKEYVSVQKPIKGKVDKGSIKKEYPNISVWIWCRALSNPIKDEDELKGQVFNITPFVQQLNTNVAKTGGNFSLTLPPLTCEYSDGKWIVKKDTLKTGSSSGVYNMEFASRDTLHKVVTGQGETRLVRNDFLFNSILSTNDLVFIRFETLSLEGQSREIDNQDFIVGTDQLPNKIYDMIGLIDNNGVTLESSSTDVTVRITGRDLSKLFIEDGTYFFQQELSQGIFYVSGGATQKNSLMQRAFPDNMIAGSHLFFNQSIEHVLQFVIQQLSTIKIIPDDLLQFYIDENGNDRRNTRTDPDTDPNNKFNQIDLDTKSYKDDAKNQIKSIRQSAGIYEGTLDSETIMVENLFNKLVSLVNLVKSQNIAVISGNVVIGWGPFEFTNERGVSEDVIQDNLTSYLSIQLGTQNISTNSNILALLVSVSNYVSTTNSKPTYKKDNSKELCAGIWQIVKLVIDRGVSARRIVDSSLSSANGSLLNWIHKVVQEPFVEFSMDTFGDMYYLIVRKPPFDRIGMTTYIDGNVVTEKGVVVGENPPAIIDIQESDVLQETLDYNSTDIYSWYHFTPHSSFFGGDTYSTAYIPAIFLPEYAEIWGSRPLDLVNNYDPFLPLDKEDKDSLNKAEEQAFEDLKYMIETTAYLPFTRRGVIMINGDRRIKRGMFIRYRATSEIFHVDHVYQSYSITENGIDRTTTLQVSRGMVESFIFGQNVEGLGNVSYFDIVNTKIDLGQKNVTTSTDIPFTGTSTSTTQIDRGTLVANIKVNKGIFNYFLRRRQIGEKLLYTAHQGQSQEIDNPSLTDAKNNFF